jgi:hypothetical protein
VGCYVGNVVDVVKAGVFSFLIVALAGSHAISERSSFAEIRCDQILADAWWLEQIAMPQAMPCVEMHEEKDYVGDQIQLGGKYMVVVACELSWISHHTAMMQ